MDEQILVKSYSPRTFRLILIMAVIGLLLSVVSFVVQYISNQDSYAEYLETYAQHQENGSCGRFYSSRELCYQCKRAEKYSSAITMTLCNVTVWSPVLGMPLLGLLIKLLFTSCSITVTDKRVCCRTLWIFHTSLPVDSITAVSRIALLGCVAITVPSSHIVAALVINAKEIYNTVNDLLIERQFRL